MVWVIFISLYATAMKMLQNARKNFEFIAECQQEVCYFVVFVKQVKKYQKCRCLENWEAVFRYYNSRTVLVYRLTVTGIANTRLIQTSI